jgi:FKBP-type peptidyl-prolyl cis-trans isomerase
MVAGLAGGAWALDDKPVAQPVQPISADEVPAAVREAQKRIEAELAAKQAAEAKAAADAAAAAAGAAPMELKTLNIEPAKPAARPVPSNDPVSTTTLESGVLIEELKIGEGAEVQKDGLVVAYYHGTLKADGKVFDSAFDRGEPAAFPLTGVIPGWQQGVPGMKVGGVRRLTIPYALAYGDAGRPPTIPAKADLVFVIELAGTVETTDVRVGTGEEVSDVCVAVLGLTIKNSAGEVVAKTEPGSPFIMIPGDLQALNMGLPGTKVGGVRSFKVPKEFTQGNMVQGTTPLSIPSGQDLHVEAEVLQVRNLR